MRNKKPPEPVPSLASIEKYEAWLAEQREAERLARIRLDIDDLLNEFEEAAILMDQAGTRSAPGARARYETARAALRDRLLLPTARRTDHDGSAS